MTRTCLDLFSGLGGFSAAFEESDDWRVVTVDLDAMFEPDLIADVMDLRPADLPDADVVLASPPCVDFSLACMNTKWDTSEGRTPRYLPKWESIPGSVALVYRTLWLVQELRPRFWFLENPRWGVLPSIINEPTGTVHYCQYGSEFKKPTALWGRHPRMEYRSCPGKPRCGHVSNPSESNAFRDGSSNAARLADVELSAERAKVPYDLSLAIREAVEDAYANPPPEQATLTEVQPMKDVTINGATLRVDPDVKGLEADLARDGIREPYTTRAYADALRALPPDPFIVDIGANVGYYAIQAATIRPDARVLAIEPAPETVEKLRANVARNGVGDRLDIRAVGVGPTEGTATLYRHSNPNRHSMSSKASGRHGSVEVPVRRLDDLLDDPGAVDALRMDIEGYEAQALRGGASVFESNDALLCNIEFHPVLMDDADNAYLRERFVGHSTVHQAAQSDRKDLGALEMAEVLEWPWIEAVFTWRA